MNMMGLALNGVYRNRSYDTKCRCHARDGVCERGVNLLNCWEGATGGLLEQVSSILSRDKSQESRRFSIIIENTSGTLHSPHSERDPELSLSRCGTALVRSVNKEKSVFSSNAVCSPEPWRFERRVSISPRLWARMRVEALRFRARRVARIIAAGPCIDKDHSSTWSSSSFAGAVEAASSRWST
jgi:hypothetical protein